MLGHMVVLFLVFLRNLHIVFHSGCTNLHPTNSVQGSLFYTSSPTFVICGLFDDSLSDRCEVISHCVLISLMSNDVEHLFMCLLAICISSLEKCLFRSSGHFEIGLFVFLILSRMSCLNILEINPLSVASFANETTDKGLKIGRAHV